MIFFSRQTALQGLSVVLIFVFTYTAFSKLIAPERFITGLKESPLLSSAATLLSWLLPAVELYVSFLLLLPVTRSTGLKASFLLLVLFIGYICYMLLFADKLPCSCGGLVEALSWKQHLGINAFLALAIFLVLKDNRSRTV